MSKSERRKIFCSVAFHLAAVVCVIWSLYVLIDRTAEEIRQGKNNGRHSHTLNLHNRIRMSFIAMYVYT